MNLFGFTIAKKAESNDNKQSFAPPTQDDGASLVSAGWITGSYIDVDGAAKTENDLINRYRDIANYPECDSAIEEIVNECISVEDSDDVVHINLDDTRLPENVKVLIDTEFKNVLELLEFRTKAHDIFKRWYIDGRIYYHKILAENIKGGIIELRYIDPRKIKRIKQIKKDKDPATGLDIITVVDDFYIYNESQTVTARGANAPSGTVQGVKISVDSIAACTSGLMDPERNAVISNLHRAVKPCNQLRMVEDAVVVNVLVRAPLRRIFNVYTGNLTASKAEQYLQDTMNRFRNKVTYDTSDGSLKDDKRTQSMLEDYWFPMDKDGNRTTVENLEGGQDIADDDKLKYYQKKLYLSLSVPFSRFEANGVINFGRQSEISKEELKFAKYINRQRRKFTELFEDILCTQLVAKGILKYDEWEAVYHKIKYIFNSDIYWQESKNNDILRDKVELIQMMDPFVGKYFSKEYIDRNVLQLSEEEKEEMDQQIEYDYQLDQQKQQQEALAQMQIQGLAQQEAGDKNGK